MHRVNQQFPRHLSGAPSSPACHRRSCYSRIKVSRTHLSTVSSLTGGLKDLRQIIPATLSPFAKNFLVALPITYCCCAHTGLTVFVRNDTVVHVVVTRATRWPPSHNQRADQRWWAEQLLFANLPPVQGLGQARLGSHAGGEYC